MEGHSMHLEQAKNRNALIWSTILTGIYFVIELGVGLYLNSVSVTSDAMHTFSAVGGTIIALVAAHFALETATPQKTFGLYRAEILGALANGLFLLLMALVILWMGIMRLQDPMDLPSGPMLWVAGGGLVTEIISMYLLYGGQKGNLNIRGAFWHVMQTFIGSLLIILSALVIRFTGFMQIDPIVGILFGLVLIWVSMGLIRQSANIVLETVPKHLNLSKVKKELEKLPNVRNAHHIHAWKLDSGKNVFSAHVLVKDMNKAQQTITQGDTLLKDQYKLYFTTIQAEEKMCTEEPTELDFLV